MKKILLAFVAVIVVVGAYVAYQASQPTVESKTDREMRDVDVEELSLE